MSEKRAKGDDEEEQQFRLELGARLKRAARAAGLSSEEVGRRLGLGGPAVRHWWAGRASPSGAQLLRYAQVVRVPPEVLTYGVQGADSLVTLFLRYLERVTGGEMPEAVIRELDPNHDHPAGWLDALRQLTPGLIADLEREAGRPFRSLSGPEQRRLLRGFAMRFLALAEEGEEEDGPSLGDRRAG